MRYKPWGVYATLTITHRKEMGLYSNRAYAESDAARYRRMLPAVAKVEVVWIGVNPDAN
jgi:hypothetical protein